MQHKKITAEGRAVPPRARRSARTAGIAILAAAGLVVAACSSPSSGASGASSPGSASSSASPSSAGPSSDPGSTTGASSTPSGGGGGGTGGVACGHMQIGIIGPLTGPSSSFGEADKDSATLAIDEYNQKHPDCTVSLVEFDTQGDAAKAPAAVQKAIQQQDIVAVLGPEFSGGAEAGTPILDQAGMPMVTSDATSGNLSTHGWKVFHRTVGSDNIEAPGEAVWTVQKAGLKSVAVINNGQSYGKGIADSYAAVLPKIGGKVAMSAAIDAAASNYSSTVLAIKGSGAQAVYCGCLYAEAARLLKQLRQGGVTAQFVTDAGAIESKFGELAGATNAEGAVAGETGVLSNENAATKAFFASYVKKFGAGAAQTYAAEGYDAARAILMAIAAGNHSRSAINTYLATVSFDGPSGHVAFKSDGDVASSTVTIVKYTSGGWTFSTSVAVPANLTTGGS